MKETIPLQLRRGARAAYGWLIAVCAGVLILLASAPVAAPAAAQAPTPTTPPMPSNVYPTRSVFLRAGPSVGWRVIATLSAGETLAVSDRYYNWYKVSRSDGTVGWVSGAYVTGDPPGSGGGGGSTGVPIFQRAPDTGQLAMVTAPLLNVRSGPGLTFSVVGTAGNGEIVTVVGKNGAWRQIVTGGGVTGWVNSYYLSGSLGAAAGGGGTTTTGTTSTGSPGGPLVIRLLAFDHAERDASRQGGAIVTMKLEFQGGTAPFSITSDTVLKASGLIPASRVETGSGVVIETLFFTETAECAGTMVHTIVLRSADGQSVTQPYFVGGIVCPNP